MEISSLISLEIVRKGRPFSDGDFIKQLLKEIWQRLNNNIKFILYTATHRTLQLRTSKESQIRKKLINCENSSLCLNESTDINDFIFYFYLSYKHGLILSQI